MKNNRICWRCNRLLTTKEREIGCGPKMVRVQCEPCKDFGPWRNSEKEAFKAWPDRHELPREVRV